MPSRINSTTTSPGGLISTGDSDNSLLIQTGDTTAITISSTQQVTLTGNLTVTAGSASTPAISPSGDSNTGVFFPAADTIAFAEGGAEVARFDSSGNLLVGATSSYSGKNQSWGAVTANAATPNFAAIDTTAVASGVGGELAFIGQFQSSSYAYFGSIRGIKENSTSGNTACALTFFTRPTATAPLERMRISSTGGLSVGTTSDPGAGAINATGNITAYFSSDRSLKENIKDIDGALDKVCAIGSKTFDWTDEYIAAHGGEDGYFVQKSDFGVVAQDVQAVFPQAVRTREDGTLAVDYEKLATLSFGAIKELLKRVEALEAK
jgi:hypothetical protein